MASARTSNGQTRRKSPDSAVSLFGGGYAPIPKAYITPEYLKQVGPRSLAFIILLVNAYDEGVMQHGLRDGWLAMPDDYVRKCLGQKGNDGVAKARKLVMAASPSFFEATRMGRSGRPWEYKIRRLGPQDRPVVLRCTVGLPERGDDNGILPALSVIQDGPAARLETGYAVSDRRTTACNADNLNANLLLAALKYRGRGMSVIPVGPDKISLVKWTQYQSAVASERELTKWWKRWPNANVAIVTGKVSNLVGIDFDGDLEIGTRWLAEQGVSLPETTTVRTARGCHLWYRYPGETVKTLSGWVKLQGVQIDIRGDGGYVVAPPSDHADGTRYEFSKDVDELPELPGAILPLLGRTHRGPGVAGPRISQDEIEALLEGDWSRVVAGAAGVELRREGDSYVGLCPLHEETTPSFSLNARKGLWHCFGCNEGGNIIQFLQRMNGGSFQKAVKTLRAAKKNETARKAAESTESPSTAEREPLSFPRDIGKSALNASGCATGDGVSGILEQSDEQSPDAQEAA